MIFIVAAIVIIVISFIVALFSLIREQSKIEKENVEVRVDHDQPKGELPQGPREIVHKQELPQMASFGNQPETQSQAPVQSLQQADLPLKEKPWWESELQGAERKTRDAIDWQKVSQGKQPIFGDLKTVTKAKDLASDDRISSQTSHEKDQTLQGSFSVADLAGENQES